MVSAGDGAMAIAAGAGLALALGVFGTTNDWPQWHFTDFPDKSVVDFETLLHVGQLTCIFAASAGLRLEMG